MQYYKATIEILVAAEGEADASDAISESLRPILRAFAPDSSFVDWRHESPQEDPQPHSGEGFEYA